MKDEKTSVQGFIFNSHIITSSNLLKANVLKMIILGFSERKSNSATGIIRKRQKDKKQCCG